MDSISFKCSADDRQMINDIADRSNKMHIEITQLDLVMNLIAVHANGNPLNFKKLLKFDDFNFMHDVLGIHNYLDRETGRLANFFSPRCSV